LLKKDVDQVVILISKLDRKTPAGMPVDRGMSERIWQIYIDSKGVGDRVSIGKSPFNTPVKAAYEVLKGTVPDLIPQPGDLIIPAASDKPKDPNKPVAKNNPPDYTRFLNFHEGIEGIIEGVIPANIMEWYYEAPTEAPMSASAFRAALDTGEGLEAFLPTGVDPKQVLDVLGAEHEPEEVLPNEPEPLLEVLSRFVEETINERKKYMEMDGLQDGVSEDKEEIAEMSGMGAGGGSAEGYAGPVDEDEVIEEDEEENPIIEQVANYLLQKEYQYA